MIETRFSRSWDSLTRRSTLCAQDHHHRTTGLHVLVQAAKQVITGERSLDTVINQALGDERPPASDQRPPSWVPNLYTRPGLNIDHRQHLRHIGTNNGTDPSSWRASQTQTPVVSFTTDNHGRAGFALVAEGVRVTTLLSVSHDPGNKPWKTFDGTNGFRIETHSTARVHDEVWVILGLSIPVTLSRLEPGKPTYTILGIAMLWDKDGKPSGVLDGSMIHLLHAGSVRPREITII